METLAAVLLLGLASYRATQLVVWDTIGDPLRLRLKVWRARKEASKVRAFLDNLIGCPYCTGWWLSMITGAVYFGITAPWSSLGDWTRNAILMWAVAGVQALANRWDDSRPGHNPEGK